MYHIYWRENISTIIIWNINSNSLKILGYQGTFKRTDEFIVIYQDILWGLLIISSKMISEMSKTLTSRANSAAENVLGGGKLLNFFQGPNLL